MTAMRTEQTQTRQRSYECFPTQTSRHDSALQVPFRDRPICSLTATSGRDPLSRTNNLILKRTFIDMPHAR
jgi:hypothetical protein